MAGIAGLDLSKQVGPLPMGAWIAVIGGGLGIAWYVNKQSSAVAADTTPAVDPGVGDGSLGGGWVSTQPPATGDGGPVGPETNEAWAVQAINWLIAQGYDATTADSAIRKYIAGSDPALSIKEYALLSLALAKFGSPPNPLPPPVNGPPTIPPPVFTPVDPKPPSMSDPPITQPPPAQNPPPAPAPSRIIFDVVTPWPTKASTLSGMASKWYKNQSKWPQIFNANRKGVRRPDGSLGMITNPDLLHTGWRIYIPPA